MKCFWLNHPSKQLYIIVTLSSSWSTSFTWLVLLSSPWSSLCSTSVFSSASSFLCSTSLFSAGISADSSLTSVLRLLAIKGILSGGSGSVTVSVTFTWRHIISLNHLMTISTPYNLSHAIEKSLCPATNKSKPKKITGNQTKEAITKDQGGTTTRSTHIWDLLVYHLLFSVISCSFSFMFDCFLLVFWIRGFWFLFCHTFVVLSSSCCGWWGCIRPCRLLLRDLLMWWCCSKCQVEFTIQWWLCFSELPTFLLLSEDPPRSRSLLKNNLKQTQNFENSGSLTFERLTATKKCLNKADSKDKGMKVTTGLEGGFKSRNVNCL